MVGKTVGHYRVVEALGSGGMGVVYKAEDLRLARHVALKFLPPGAPADALALERFQREAQAASALNHPHICTVHDIDTVDGQPFIVMELLEGQTLRERLGSRRIHLDAVLELGIEVAEALEAAHARGILHRDIKPANIFVTSAGHAKVLDFGLAKLAAERQGDGDEVTMAPPAAAVITGPGQKIGTAAYMSPEQVRGEELDARTDIFSLGVVLYEMATGVLPFQGSSIGVIFDGILNRTPAPPVQLNPALPAEFGHILDKALEKDRDLRYQSARELRADLARLRRDSGSGRSPTPVAAPAARRPRRVWTLAALTAIAAALGLAGYLARTAREPAPVQPATPTLTRITFEEGLQAQPAWSPDGRFIAYSSDQSGNFDIWVQPIGGGRAVQVTGDPAHDWQPSWSPDGNSIAFRSERDGGGIYVAPALGGSERRIASLGYDPRWSPDGSRLLIVVRPHQVTGAMVTPDLYLATPEGGEPTRILSKTLERFTEVTGAISWHRDGERLWVHGSRGEEHGVWLVPVSGAEPVVTRPQEDVERVIRQLDLSFHPSDFAISSAGDALYVAGWSKGVSNLWRIDLDPQTGRWIGGPHRLTTGPGIDDQVAVSPRGDRLAFVTKTETARLWSLPFDARGHTAGEAQPVTAAHMSVVAFDLSADGDRLVYAARRAGKEQTELWSHSFAEGRAVLLGEAPNFFVPRLSRDGARVAYRVVHRMEPQDVRLSWAASDGGAEHSMPKGLHTPWDWSPDAGRILHNCPPPAQIPSLCVSPRDASDLRQTRTVLADPGHALWQGRFSPDDRWVLFNAQNLKRSGISVIGVVPAAGGAWEALTDADLWADKPRWSPDGQAFYFISNRQGAFFDVWGRRFDPAAGKPVGAPFRVTRFENPRQALSASSAAELGVSRTRVVVPIAETSGSVWVLDTVHPGVSP